jgi:hypothetical protein
MLYIGAEKTMLQQPRHSPHVRSQQRVVWAYWIAKNIWAFIWDTDLMGLQESPLLSSIQSMVGCRAYTCVMLMGHGLHKIGNFGWATTYWCIWARDTNVQNTENVFFSFFCS